MKKNMSLSINKKPNCFHALENVEVKGLKVFRAWVIVVLLWMSRSSLESLIVALEAAEETTTRSDNSETR